MQALKGKVKGADGKLQVSLFFMPYLAKVDQDRIYTPYVTLYFMISFPKLPCIHHV